MSYEQTRVIAGQQATIRNQHLRIAALEADLTYANDTLRQAQELLDSLKDQAEATRKALA